MTPKILDREEVQKLVTSLNRNESKFYQFYNLEFSAEEYQFQDYLRNFKEGEATKKY